MTFWLDASVVVALMAVEDTSASIDRLLDQATGEILISDFCQAESSAAIARLARIGAKSREDVELLFADLDHWVERIAEVPSVHAADVAMAIDWIRRPGIALRAPDAIHIAAAHRLGVTLVTLDRGMARAAAALGVPYLNPADAQHPASMND